MAELHLEAESVSVVVDADHGGRIASLEVGGSQLLVVAGTLGPLQWGSYPMVPWAGRIRDGRFDFGGITHQLPCNLPPHAAHGVGFTSSWTVDGGDAITLDLGSPWPFGGRARQRFELDDGGLTVTLTVVADQPMPLLIGWHPWFNRFLPSPDGPVEADLRFGPAKMYELDDVAIPTGELVTPPPGPWDNCFVSLQHQPVINWPGLVRLELTSSCSHWVVYTEPEHALCVEPQTDAPDSLNRSPTIVEAGQEFEAWFRMAWS